MDAWITIINKFLTKSLDVSDHNKSKVVFGMTYEILSSEWASKKWCIKILNKLMSKYSDLSSVKDENKSFPEYFLPNYGVYFLETFFNLLRNTQNKYIPTKIHFFALRYIINGLKYSEFHQHYANLIDIILYEIILPSLLLTTQDEEDWSENPLEYIRKEEDLLDLSRNIKLAALKLLERLCDKSIINSKDDNQIIARFLEYCNQIFENGLDIRNNTVISDNRIKEAIYNILGHLSKIIIPNEKYSQQIQYLFEKFILPEFSNMPGPTRYRASYLFGAYGRLRFESLDLVLAITNSLYSSLCQDHISIRIKCGISLNLIFQNKEAQTHIKPHLQKILLSYIELLNTIDHETLTVAFEGVISKFMNDIHPFAIDLLKYLSEAFLRADQDSIQSANLNEIEEKEAVALGFLSSIIKILQSNLSKEIIIEAEEITFPVLQYILQNENSYCIDLALKILNLLLKSSETISDRLWLFLPVLIYLIIGLPEEQKQALENEENNPLRELYFHGKGEDYVREIVPCFQSYLKDQQNTIFTNQDQHYSLVYLELLFKSIEKIYEICYDCENDTDMVLITTCYIVLIEHHLQLPENILTYILDRVIENLPHSKSINMEKILLEIVSFVLFDKAFVYFSFSTT